MHIKKIIFVLSIAASHFGFGQTAELNRNAQSAISFLPSNGNSIFYISHGLNNDLNISQGTNVGDGNLMTIKNSGNVGIGTTSPAAKLDVNGGIVSRSNYLTISPAANDAVIRRGTVGNLMLCSNGGNGSIFLNYAYGSGNGGVRIYDGGTTNYGHLKVNSNGDLSLFSKSGNIGIGTTDTKGFKLGVNGKIAATEVKVATYTNWPDFVFENNYNLSTLKEVEQQIKDKGHLKDIPSAEEVKKDGFFLGDMDSKLLQKIEELTLYTIEQQKEIESQNSKIEKLEEENKELQSLSKRLAVIEALLSNKKQ